MSAPSRSAKIFLVLFALPFCGVGLFAAIAGIGASQRGAPQAWVAILAGTTFAMAGVGLLAAGTLGFRKLKDLQKAQAEHPEMPWLWREDWAHGRADSKTKSSLLTAWVMTTLWMLISSPILFVIPRERFVREPKTYFALLFPAAGLYMLAWAVRETMRWLQFGKTYFEMPIVPLVVGRDFRGTIEARFSNSPKRGVQLKLSCIRRTVSGSGKDQNTHETILWREENLVGPERLSSGPIGTSIPVAFTLPGDALPTNTLNLHDTVLWVLEADADVPGVDYRDLFEVPVFRTKDTPLSSQPAVWGKTAVMAPSHFTILVRPGIEGGTEFYFPPARNKGFAFGTSVFALVWGGIIAGMIHLRTPFIFPVVFGLFEVLMVFFTLDLLVGTSTVVIGQETMRIRTGWFGVGRMREIPFAQIAKIQSAITAQQGGATGTPYYDIQLVTTDNKKITLGKTLREKAEADWLVSEMDRLADTKPLARGAAAR